MGGRAHSRMISPVSVRWFLHYRLIGGSPVGIRPTFFSEVKMPDYRRFRVPGGTYFFTVNLLERRLDTLVRHIDVLREAVRVTKRERPFHIDA
ncbi:MAG: hypothetical protein WAW61_05685 [Methylococcaceae bacterium]